MPKSAFLAISIVLFLFIAVLSMQNFSAVPVTMLGSSSQIPLAVVSLGSFLAGALAMISLMGIKTVKAQASEQKQIEWQKQDEKLAIEIQSDKEKQLEAKIATLEQALKSALDKKNKPKS